MGFPLSRYLWLASGKFCEAVSAASPARESQRRNRPKQIGRQGSFPATSEGEKCGPIRKGQDRPILWNDVL